jgi:hypothetical protein
MAVPVQVGAKDNIRILPYAAGSVGLRVRFKRADQFDVRGSVFPLK